MVELKTELSVLADQEAVRPAQEHMVVLEQADLVQQDKEIMVAAP